MTAPRKVRENIEEVTQFNAGFSSATDTSGFRLGIEAFSLGKLGSIFVYLELMQKSIQDRQINLCYFLGIKNWVGHKKNRGHKPRVTIHRQMNNQFHCRQHSMNTEGGTPIFNQKPC